MKLLRTIFVLASFVFSAAAVAAPVTYDFAAYDFQSYVGNPAPHTNLFGSFTLDGTTVTDVDLTIGSHTYTASELGYESFLGGLACSLGCIAWGTDDFWLIFDANTLAFQNMYYTVSGVSDFWSTYTGEVTVSTAHVPESSALILMLIGLLGFAARKSRSAA